MVEQHDDTETLYTTREIAEANEWSPQNVIARAYARQQFPSRKGPMRYWTAEQRRIIEAPLEEYRG